MFDFIVADYLYKVSDLIEVLEGENYRSKAFFKAALAIDGYGKNAYNLYLKGELKNVPNIGSKMESYIKEIIETGKLGVLQERQGSLPDSIFEIINLPQLNSKIIRRLFDNRVFCLKDLTLLIQEGQLLNIGLKSSEIKRISDSIKKNENEHGRFQLGHAYVISLEILEWLKDRKAVVLADITGQVRTRNETVTQLDFICCYKEGTKVGSLLKKCPMLTNIQKTEFGGYIAETYFGLPVTFIAAESEHYYCELVKTTGPQIFVEEIKKKNCNYERDTYNCQSELEVFNKLELGYCIPEMRGVIGLDSIPPSESVIDERDIIGDLHIHSNWSDGLDDIELLAERAMAMGHKYIAICDHSVSLKVANGLSQDSLLKQIEKIRTLNDKNEEFKIITGAEVDIKPNGALDYPDYILKQLDFVVASIHSSFNMPRQQLMDRIKKALSNKYVNVFAHPTGRLLGKPGRIFEKRTELDIDFKELLNICKENNIALEINAFPERLDLSKERALEARSKGVKLSIGTDSHSYGHLDLYKFGVFIARGAGSNKDDVLNTYPYERLIKYFQSKKDEETDDVVSTFNGLRDFYHYFGNNKQILNGEKTVVGIDLTASKKKASGWAYLSSNNTITKLLGSDEDLIETTIQYKPDIISIDSPLSLPAGRCCSNDDCSCRKKGIMRYCEKTLMRIGIGVFPCLLPSMVGLTERGIKLNKVFKDLGFEVIESYPGVAQDILNISRKKKGLDNLIRGLKNFGFVGDIDKLKINHDEVDAITSALVGYFYINDQYIPLGLDEENFLIIPRIQTDLLSKRLIIGLSGESACGKTTLAEYLRFKYGFKYKRYSQIIQQMLGGVASKQELQQKGSEINRTPESQRQLSIKIIETMDADTSYVIDGLRHLEDFYTLKEHFNEDFYLIFIDTNFNNRYKRYSANWDSEIEREKFLKISNHEVELNIPLLALKTADHIDNNKGFIDMFRQVDNILADILNRRRSN